MLLFCIHTNISLRGANMMDIVSPRQAFFNSFPLETDFFFRNFWIEFGGNNGKKSDESSNTVSVGTLIEETQLELIREN